MKLIQLRRGEFAKIDDEDFDLVSKYKWYANKNGRTKYAKSTTRNNNVQTIVLMHRLVFQGEIKGKQIDHIDGDGLNNQKSNLRICSYSENQMNRKPRTDTLSKFKGVTFRPRERKWYASIKINGKSKTLGRFEVEIDAAITYDNAAKELFGEYARLNFS